MRQIIVYEGLLEKFRKNDELKEKLLATEQDILAECAVQDKIWGIGLSMKQMSCYKMHVSEFFTYHDIKMKKEILL